MKAEEWSSDDIKWKIINAGEKAVNELIKVAEEKIITNEEGDLTADKLKNAASSKKLAIFDAFEILDRIGDERKILLSATESQEDLNKIKVESEEVIPTSFVEERAAGK